MLMPDFVTKKMDMSETYGKFVFTPLPAGFGNSIGNALRRVMLSSIEGTAITYVKINDVVHPFSTIEGVKESGLDIILNLKELRFQATGNGPFTMTLAKKGKGMVTGADFNGGDVTVVNSDQHIAELTTPKAHLDIELTLERGIGYSPSEEKEKSGFGVLPMDSVFSPVEKVVYKVEDERVGRKTNFDKLTLEVWTNGSLTSETALQQSAQLLSQYFGYMMSGNDAEARRAENAESARAELAQVDPQVYDIIIDELDLPTRVINALLREKIETVGDLAERGQEALASLKGVGRKSISLIEKEIEKLGVILEDK
jgi:DNA-directed RNA polymerase subunit alpha